MKTLIEHKVSQSQERVPVVAYLRVSSNSDEQLESYHAQKDYLQKRFEKSKTENLVAVYGDEGKSGRTQTRRVEFNQMMIDAKLGKFKTIYTKSLSRFGRNGEQTLESLNELKDCGVNVIFESENLDSKNLSQELLIKIKAILAEEESNVISSNLKWSYQKRFQKGILNTMTSLYGYDISPCKMVWTINEEEAETVRLIFKMYLEGKGKVKILQHLNELKIKSPSGADNWTEQTVLRILANEKYTGNLILQKTYRQDSKVILNKGEKQRYFVEDTHPAIIDQTIFDKVQVIQRERAEAIKFTTSVKSEYELSGVIECGLCGKKFKRRVNHKIKNFDKVGWICVTANTHGLKACRANQISDELLKEILLDAFNEYLKTPHNSPLIEFTKEEINKLVIRENSMRELMTKNVITYMQFMDEQKLIKAEYERLEKIIESEQGNGLYKKQGQPRTQYSEDIVMQHIEKITMRGYVITVTFKNTQIIKGRYKYEHRKYVKDTD